MAGVEGLVHGFHGDFTRIYPASIELRFTHPLYVVPIPVPSPHGVFVRKLPIFRYIAVFYGNNFFSVTSLIKRFVPLDFFLSPWEWVEAEINEQEIVKWTNVRATFMLKTRIVPNLTA